MTRRLAPVLAIAILVAACGGGDGSETLDAPAGLQAYADDAISLQLPAGWEVVAAGDVDVEEVLSLGIEELGLDSTSTADALAAQFAAGVRMFAFDFDGSEAGFVDNLNVLEGPVPPFGAEDLLQLNVDQMEQAGWVILETELRSFPAGDGFFMRFDFAPGGAVEGALSATIVTDDAQWVLTFTATDPDRARAEFEAITTSFRER